MGIRHRNARCTPVAFGRCSWCEKRKSLLRYGPLNYGSRGREQMACFDCSLQQMLSIRSWRSYFRDLDQKMNQDLEVDAAEKAYEYSDEE